MVHERVPERGPIPDLILDLVDDVKWALAASEIMIMVISNVAMLVVISHKHRSVATKNLCPNYKHGIDISPSFA